MRIVVTGLSGNLGTALLRRLFTATGTTAPVGAGDHEVVGVCRRPPSGEPYQLAEWVGLDLASDEAQTRLWEVFQGADAVVHLAWDFQPSHRVEYLHKVAVEGTRAVLAAADAAGVPHLVHLSSLGAYSPGPKDRAVDESWPTEGIDSLAYSIEKVAAERLLDDDEAGSGRMLITRIRPALVVQGDAGSAILRYGTPAFLPGQALALLKLLPVDRDLVIQAVHSDDVADALVRVLDQRAGGAFNLAADPPLTRDRIAEALGARPVHLPRQVLRTATALGWRTHLQPLDPGWIDLAFAVPLLDSGRARRELGWEPRYDAVTALAELIAGMREQRGTASPVLRPRSVLKDLARSVSRGPVAQRRLP